MTCHKHLDAIVISTIIRYVSYRQEAPTERVGKLNTRQILIEFLNPHDVPGYLVGSLPDALQLLACCENRVQLQFDLYHAARCELNLAAENIAVSSDDWRRQGRRRPPQT